MAVSSSLLCKIMKEISYIMQFIYLSEKERIKLMVPNG